MEMELVTHILTTAQTGPHSANSLFSTAVITSGTSLIHLDFVITQLKIAGYVHEIADGRIITTGQGDDYLLLKTQHIDNN